MNVTATPIPSGDHDPRFEELFERFSRTYDRHDAAYLALRVWVRELDQYDRAPECLECGSKCYDDELRRARRSDSRYCSSACRQRAYRRRKTEATA
jgi:hypothetical protein